MTHLCDSLGFIEEQPMKLKHDPVAVKVGTWFLALLAIAARAK